MFRNLSFIAILMTAFSLANCTENESRSQILSRLEALGAILEGQDAAALDLQQQRLYVDPGKISFSEQGSMLYSMGEKSVPLPALYSCGNGFYVECSERDLEALAETDDLRIWWCKRCQAFRKMNKYNRCSSCGGVL